MAVNQKMIVSNRCNPAWECRSAQLPNSRTECGNFTGGQKLAP